ncbi:cell division protein FtsZ [Flavobacteriaceae bacterium]|nr:cell division protein FtsZ [Flavobacteriaceae bacterium]
MGTLENNNISFDLPISQSNTIKVIGVGGGGSNAVNHMFQQSIRGVDFVICNTDAQALDNSAIPNKIQLGAELTSGLGAGANPEVGKQAAEESLQELQQMLSNQTKMVFITAGMGGGTGTGAAPIIAKLAKDMDVLTVGIVTMPFQFEGKSRMMQAKKGIEMLREQVDSLIVINNNKLREVYGNLGFKAGFSKADEVLSTAAKGIAEVITHHYKQNIDLNDAKRVLSNSGTAIMGSSKESGTDRAQVAIKKALDSPLLNDNKITGAKNVLLLIVSGTTEVTIDEIGDINDFIQTEAGFDANIIMGVGEDESLEDSIAITVVATGFATDQQNEMSSGEQRKVVHVLESEQKATYEFEEPKNNIIDTPKVRVEVPKAPEKIVHELIEEEEVPQVNIMDVEVVDFRIVEAVPEPEVLTIDFPEESVVNPFEMEVVDPVEIKADVEAPTVVFSLDDFDDSEEIKKDFSSVTPTIGKSSTISTEKFKRTLDIEDEDLQIEIKTKPVAVEEIEVRDHQEISPLHMSIEQLRQTADDRKSKLKKFNYSFRSGQQHIDDIEKEPAYKRQGVELNSRPGELNSSRTSIDLDENDQPKLRSNNSFLHDNVD